MILSLDFVSQRYGVLPSQLLRSGDSLDLIIADAAQGYRNKQQEAANKGEKLTNSSHNLSEQQMKDMIERAKNKAVKL
jgi:hypothetical protein